MQISENFSFLSFSSENDYPWASQYRTVGVSRPGGCTTYLRFVPSVRIHVEDVGIVQINVPSVFACIIMASKDNYWCTWKSGGMSTSWAWWDTFYERLGPLPFSWFEFFGIERSLWFYLALGFLFAFFVPFFWLIFLPKFILLFLFILLLIILLIFLLIVVILFKVLLVLVILILHDSFIYLKFI